MSDEEDDYMSEKILNACVKSDVRPGLQFSKQQKREHELFKKREETRPKPFTTLAEERLHEGLQTALPESNKGFSLLAKMGYKPGTGVGKSVTGTSQPINIDLKKGTSGLGFGKREKRERKSECVPSTEEYRDMLKKRQEINHMKADFSKTRGICYFLDKKENIENPIEKWYWPENTIKDEEAEEDDESDDEDDDESPPKKMKILSYDELKSRLDTLSQYVRIKYFYCIWCSVNYLDEKDMKEFCPGRSKKLHEEEKDSDSDEDD